MNPSHHRRDFRSWRSSTTAVAIPHPLPRLDRLRLRRPPEAPVGDRYTILSERIKDGGRRDGSPTRPVPRPRPSPPATARSRARPVVLATLSVRVDAEAERMALESALEAGVRADHREHDPDAGLPDDDDAGARVRHVAARGGSRRGPRDRRPRRRLGIATELLRITSRRPLQALLELLSERDAGLLVFGPDRRLISRARFHGRGLDRAPPRELPGLDRPERLSGRRRPARDRPSDPGQRRPATSASSISSVSSRSSMRSVLPEVLIASSYIVTSLGQATTNSSTSARPTASRMRFSDGRSWPGVSGIQMRPPPAPQQNELSRLRGISTSVQPSRSRISRGAS